MNTRRLLVIATLTLLPSFGFAPVRDAAAAEQLGKVSFPTSCDPKVQAQFESGVAMLHSFWYSAATATFEEVAGEDPACAIAAWGFASILMSNPLGGAGATPKDAEDRKSVV